jgi:steroid delta-isomerase-like uncharacterized protein
MTLSPAHVSLLRRHLEAENAHRLEDTLATLTEDCVFDDRALGKVFHGHAGAAEYYERWWRAFDPIVTREDLFATTGGGAIAETRWRGRHVGTFLGIEATGLEIDLPVAIFVDFRDDLMAGERLYWDRGTLWHQLGVALRSVG